jgi:hypothetical protein
MFEKIGRLAETAATRVSLSRRGFLGRLGQGALTMTGVLGGLLAIPRDTRAGGSYVCCTWTYYPNLYKQNHPRKVKYCYPPGSTCQPQAKQTPVSSCSKC